MYLCLSEEITDMQVEELVKTKTKRSFLSENSPIHGWAFHNINRRVALPLAKLTLKLKASTNILIIIMCLMALVATFFAGTGHRILLILSGLMFQQSAMMRGAVEEVRMLKNENTPMSVLILKVIDILRFTIYFAAMAFGTYRSNNVDYEFYFYATLVFVAIGLYVTGRVGHLTWNQSQESEGSLQEIQKDTSNKYASYFKMFLGLEKQDVPPLIGLIMCIAGLRIPLFWMAAIASVVVAFGVMRASKKKKSGFSMPDPFFFYIIGVVLLCALIYNMDLNIIAESLSKIGYGVIVAFATAILWVLVNTWSLSILLEHKMSFKSLLYVELTGNAYNNIIPLAGLGGEPYKIKVISDHVGFDNASRVIIQNRLIHSLTGLLFTALIVIMCLLTVDLSKHSEYFTFLAIAAAISGAISMTIAWITLSSAPGKFTGYILKKLNFLKDYKNKPLPKGRFLIAVFWQVVGRTFNLVEIYVIFVLVGFDPTLPDLICVSTFLSLSGAIFFLIPQGLGVNEASISTAFSILGYSTTLGISFGLIRRARVIVWALLGVALHLFVMFKSNLGKSNELRSSASGTTL